MGTIYVMAKAPMGLTTWSTGFGMDRKGFGTETYSGELVKSLKAHLETKGSVAIDVNRAEPEESVEDLAARDAVLILVSPYLKGYVEATDDKVMFLTDDEFAGGDLSRIYQRIDGLLN